MNTSEAMQLSPTGQGVRFFVVGLPGDWDEDEELTYSTLAACLRMSDDIDTEGYSNAELWSDFVVPAIVAGTIEHAVWGVIS